VSTIQSGLIRGDLPRDGGASARSVRASASANESGSDRRASVNARVSVRACDRACARACSSDGDRARRRVVPCACVRARVRLSSRI
jgi:hypothetical protein